MSVRTLILTMIFAVLMPALRARANVVTPNTMDSLRMELKKSYYPQDSLVVLYNMYDAGTNLEKKAMAKMFYKVAKRAGDVKARLDILRNLGNLYLGNDSVQKLILAEAERIPPNPEQKETVMFIRLLIVTTNSLMKSTDKKQKFLMDALNNYRELDENTSDLKKIEMLYTLCVYLGATVQGDLLDKYLGETEALIDKLPYGLYAFHNMYYAHSAIVYTRNMEFEKAVDADRNLLEIIDRLEDEYKQKGRVFKNFNRNRYICYRRMLYNYPALTPAEVEEAWAQIQRLAREESEVRSDMEQNHLAEIFYYMAHKDYAKAKPLLAAVVNKDLRGSNYLKTHLYKMLSEAAEATGDLELQRLTLIAYADHLNKSIKSKSADRYRELQIIYDMHDLRSQNAQLEEESEARHIKNQRIIIIVCGIASILLLVACLFLYRLYRRANRLSKGLADMNKILKSESAALKLSEKKLIEARDAANSADKLKSDFIDNMTHEVREPLEAISGYTQLIIDNMGAEDRKRLDKYARLVELNCDLISTLVYDVLSLSTINKGTMSVVKSRVSLNEICDIAIDSVSARRNDKVKLVFAKEVSKDTMIFTDAHRVQQVLSNLLQNAFKFTPEGSVVLDYNIDDAAGTMSFSVTDTGCGVPPGKEEVIFERFEKLDPNTQGVGLGLAIARHIARLLGGDVVLDATYRRGARFVFTIPIQ